MLRIAGRHLEPPSTTAVRWEVATPWYDTQNKLETVVAGEQSLSFPGAPAGLADLEIRIFSSHPRMQPNTRTSLPESALPTAPDVSDGFLGKMLVVLEKPALAPVMIFL